ncbi:MAG: restriction endonuclease [Planctomycetota bacterium]
MVSSRRRVLLRAKGDLRRATMTIPRHDELFRPLLELATKQDLTRRMATEAMSDAFQLNAEERSRRLPSGSATYIGNRTGWAMTFLTKGRLIEKVARSTYRATPSGRAFLAAHPKTITVKDLEAIDGWDEAWKSTRVRSAESGEDKAVELVESPAEAIDSAVEQLHAALRAKVLDSILAQTPEFFEQLVLDVLVRMGYGGSRDEAAVRLGRSGDEGIDGRINQDPLGLDQILVQAKRYKPDLLIDRKTIQAFIGSLAGQGVSKGIFITTSSFQSSAREFVQRGANTKVVLLDGNALVDLMMRHHVGVRVQRTIELLDLDQNYFEDEE